MGPHVNGICAVDASNAWAAVDNDLMVRTIDGENWTEYKIPSVVGNGFYLISVSALDMDNL